MQRLHSETRCRFAPLASTLATTSRIADISKRPTMAHSGAPSRLPSLSRYTYIDSCVTASEAWASNSRRPSVYRRTARQRKCITVLGCLYCPSVVNGAFWPFWHCYCLRQMRYGRRSTTSWIIHALVRCYYAFRSLALEGEGPPSPCSKSLDMYICQSMKLDL